MSYCLIKPFVFYELLEAKVHLPPLNILIEYFYLILAVCLIVITVFIVRFVLAVVKTLKNFDKTISLANDRVRQLEPIIEGVNKLEDKVSETLTLVDHRVEKVQEDISRLIDEVIDTLNDYRGLEKALEERISDQLPPILNETKELVSEVNEVARDIEAKIKSTDNLFKSIDEVGQTVRMVSGIVKGGFTGLAIQVASMAVGLRRSLEYVSENIHTKEVKKDE